MTSFDLLKNQIDRSPTLNRPSLAHMLPSHASSVDGVVTTNFDFGLTKAQQRRFQLEPTLEGRLLSQPCEVGLAADACDNIEAWLKDGREFSFGGETNAPLYLHGSLVSPKDVVFTASDYDTFYKVEVGRNPNTGVFFFEQLLGNATLVFIGYSFTDPFIDTVLSKVAKRPVWQGDHFALFGVRETDELDKQTRKLRDLRIAPIYYPITAPDHPGPAMLVGRIESYVGNDRAVVRMCEISPHSSSRHAFDGQWVSATDLARCSIVHCRGKPNNRDELPGLSPSIRIERHREIARLESFVNDIRVRIVGVVGLGGTAKRRLFVKFLKTRNSRWNGFPTGF